MSYIITFVLFQILTSDTCKKVQNFETCSAGHNSLLGKADPRGPWTLITRILLWVSSVYDNI